LAGGQALYACLGKNKGVFTAESSRGRRLNAARTCRPAHRPPLNALASCRWYLPCNCWDTLPCLEQLLPSSSRCAMQFSNSQLRPARHGEATVQAAVARCSQQPSGSAGIFAGQPPQAHRSGSFTAQQQVATRKLGAPAPWLRSVLLAVARAVVPQWQQQQHGYVRQQAGVECMVPQQHACYANSSRGGFMVVQAFPPLLRPGR
jgi:hypothetical protein